MDALLTIDDAAHMLGVTRRAAYELAESRDPDLRLPAVRIGRRLRFRPADLERYVEARAS